MDSDVRRPLAAVSAMNDEGNTVVFSRKYGSYIENDATGERIKIERVGNTFEMRLKVGKGGSGGKGRNEKRVDMEIGANEEDKDDEEMAEDVEKEEEGKVVFSRRTQN